MRGLSAVVLAVFLVAFYFLPHGEIKQWMAVGAFVSFCALALPKQTKKVEVKK